MTVTDGNAVYTVYSLRVAGATTDFSKHNSTQLLGNNTEILIFKDGWLWVKIDGFKPFIHT